MGYKTIRTSDLTGAVLEAPQVVTVIVRSHPQLTEPTPFDAGADEVAALRSRQDLVVLELKRADGTGETVICSVEDFDAVVPAEVVRNAPGTRGRRPGYSPVAI